MDLPINSKINGMELIHEGNINEYSKKQVKFKNTNNTSTNQKYQLLLKTKIDKTEIGKIKIFDLEVVNISSYNADYPTYFRFLVRLTLGNSKLNTYIRLIEDYGADKHLPNGLPIVAYSEESTSDYIIYVLCKTEETSCRFQINPIFVLNDRDNEEIIISGNVYTESEFAEFTNDKTSITVKNIKRFDTARIKTGTIDTANITTGTIGNLSVSKLNTSLIPSKLGGTNGLDLGSSSERFRGCYFSNYIGLPSQSTSGRPTTSSTPPVFNGCMIFDSSLAKIIVYWHGNWYDAMGKIV